MKQLVDVVPKYVNEAKPGKKYGSIKLADNTKYMVPAAMVKEFAEEVPAKIEFEQQKWGDGPVEVVTRKVWTGEVTGPSDVKSAPALNGAAKDRRITELALIKLVQIPFGTREDMCHRMTEVWLAARDTVDRMNEDGISF